MTREEAKKIFGELLLFGKAPCKKEELEDLCKIVLAALEQEPTIKNDLVVDCISRQAVLDAFADYVGSGMSMNDFDALWDIVKKIQPVNPQEPKFIAKSDGTIEQLKNCEDCIYKKEWEKIGKLLSIVLEKQTEQEPTSFQWCTDCKEYDQEKHCCHRWSKVIRNTVEEMKQQQEPCDKCEVGNPCLYCKHEFEPQESENKE